MGTKAFRAQGIQGEDGYDQRTEEVFPQHWTWGVCVQPAYGK